MIYVLCLLLVWPMFSGSADPLRISIFETYHALHSVDELPLNHDGNRDACHIENESLQPGERRSWFINGTTCSAQRRCIEMAIFFRSVEHRFAAMSMSNCGTWINLHIPNEIIENSQISS